ncbi:hypothetical protein RI543_000228 [Arxiozyma heterogenica]|uniref:SAGA complex subunit Spt7 n=1 Tax=Arxiozyma heterogenica TaxID=278026 RepID=A0AAN7ZZ56_9SACH|nr:hypothetical protein RI543_000228 [Kazachstania heterogenica]
MFHCIPIINYQTTHLKSLLNITEKLHSNHIFESYLTPQQLILLEYILSIKDPDIKEKIWNELMNANLVLDVITTTNPSTNNYSNITQDREINTNVSNNEKKLDNTKDTSNSGNEKLTIDEVNADINQLDLTELSQHITTPGFIGNLSMKIRYVLWQCAIDTAFKVPSKIEVLAEDNQQHNVFDYVLLDEISDKNDGSSTKPFLSTTEMLSTKSKLTDNYSDDNYDEDDDDYDCEPAERQEYKDQKTFFNDQGVILKTDEQNRLVLTIEISTTTLSKLQTNNYDAIMENWTKIYHSFEYDKETVMKRLKLEANNELLEKEKDRKRPLETENSEKKNMSDNTPEDNNSDYEEEQNTSKRPKHESISLSTNLGIANLSLKHLLNAIQTDKTKVNLSDYELKTLITDVKKNRSKWSSDDRIGQEELYEACEKVVLELRNYTEHSTPFLNKVSKREAPNYHLVIKKSMDLNTVLKKLKTFQYDSKQDFVDDIMLIWKNCLTYNSDPSHFLRAHAIAMQKKSLQLIPMIPNITVRSRAEVERELAEMEKDKDYEEDGEDEEEEEVAGSGRKGLNMGAHKPACDDFDNDKVNMQKSDDAIEDHVSGNNASITTVDNIDKLKSDQTISMNNSEGTDTKKNDVTTGLHVQDTSNENSEIKSELYSEKLNNIPDSLSHTSKDTTNTVHESNSKTDDEKNKSISANTSEQTHMIDTKNVKREVKEEDVKATDEDNEEEREEIDETQNFINEIDDDRDDIEISVWKSATAKCRAEICLKRSEHFTNGRINTMSKALLKDPNKMKSHSLLWQEYKQQKEIELLQQKLEQESIMKNGFGTSFKEEESEQNIYDESTKVLFGDNAVTDIDYENSSLLQEYNVVNTLPNLEYNGIPSEVLDKQETSYINQLLETGVAHHSIYQKNVRKGMSVQMNANISLIQQIRHICHKISIIRMLQNPQYLQNTKNSQSSFNISKHKFSYSDIDDTVDIDPISQMNTHDYRNNKELIWRIMHKNVSKISMANGFETTQPSAINILTEIASDYLSNLIKTMKLHHESNSLNTKNTEEILHLTLLENGIPRPDSLYSYIENEFKKKTKKLKDIKTKLESFLKDLLRPTLQELSERNFEDESENFLTGNFASELTGEDFFGFQELGLDKEFGILSSSVPLQLLTTQFQAIDSEKKVQHNKVQPEEIDSVNYYKITKKDIQTNNRYHILKPLLKKAYEKSKLYSLRPVKNGPVLKSPSHDPENDMYIILEDEEIPQKKGSSKLRLPPTGKISTVYKRKVIANAFFIPELPSTNLETPQINYVKSGDEDDEGQLLNSNESFQFENSSSILSPIQKITETSNVTVDSPTQNTNTPTNESFSLELPKIE